MDRKKLFIVIFILILAGAGLLFYAVSYQGRQGDDAQSQELRIAKVIEEPVISPIGSHDGNSVWYFTPEGKLFSIATDGSNRSEFSLPQAVGQLRFALWPKAGNDFIAVYRVEGTEYEQPAVVLNKYHYDGSAKIFTGLAYNIQWIEWLPDSQRVVYIWQSDDKQSQQLVTANADGSGYRTVADVFWADLALKASSDGATVLMYRTSIQGDTNKIYAANISTGVISTLVETGKNTAAKWISENKFIFQRDSKLYLYDMINRQEKDLNLATGIERAVVDAAGLNLYAAVAKETGGGDNFVKVNLNNLAKDDYFNPQEETRVKEVLIIGNTIYYINSQDNKFYGLVRG